LKTQDKPTIPSVELYVEQLVREGNRKIASDPNAQPYVPNWDMNDPEKRTMNAKKLIQRAVKEHVERVIVLAPGGFISSEQYAEIQANGPTLAIEVLRRRAAVAEGEARRQALIASTSLHHLAGLHAREMRKAKDRRASLSPGRRIDNALASLSSVSMVPASALGGDQVRGGDPNRTPKWGGDQFGSSRAKAVRLAEELEALVDECKCRDLGAAA
jgi:hypothetical protein